MLLVYFIASDLAKEQKLNFGDDIASELRLARKKRFSIQEEKRIAQEIELHSYLNKLVEKDKEEQVNKIQNEEGDNSSSRAKIKDIEIKCVSCINFILLKIEVNIFRIIILWNSINYLPKLMKEEGLVDSFEIDVF